MIYRDQLEAVYRLIEDKKRWTQGHYARDAYGEPICDEDGEEIAAERAVLSSNATCWCIWGAAYKCGIRGNAADEAFAAALGFTTVYDPNIFNDSHCHAEVLSLLSNAIERAPVRP